MKKQKIAIAGNTTPSSSPDGAKLYWRGEVVGMLHSDPLIAGSECKIEIINHELFNQMSMAMMLEKAEQKIKESYENGLLKLTSKLKG